MPDGGMADAEDSKSSGVPWGFDPPPGTQIFTAIETS